MRVVVVGGMPEREAGEGETDNVVDTAAMTPGARYDLALLMTQQGLGELVGRLHDEHADLFDVAATDSGDDATDDPEDGEPSWKQGGLASVKTVYPESSEYHGMPALEGSPQAWLDTMGSDLRAMGIDPVSPVDAVELWWPGEGATHYEVGAVIGGVYAKFDLTTEGYRLIHNASRPVAGAYYRGASTYVTSSVTASDLYGTFLGIAAEHGPFSMDTNDCERFATTLCARLAGTWQNNEST